MHFRIPLTWILAMDGRHAKVWECRDLSGSLRVVPDYSFDAEDQTSFSRALKSDRPGRSFASSGARRSAIQPKSDPHDLEKARFAAQVSERLTQAAEERQFEQLVVIAPPKLLGEIRNTYSRSLQAALIGEVAKELAYQNADDIWRHARTVLVNRHGM